jgi:hypothetical protein
MTQIRLFSYHDLDASQLHNRRMAELVRPGVYLGYRVRRNASDPSKLDISHGDDSTSVLLTVEGVRIQETQELIGELRVDAADPVYPRFDLVVAEYRWSPNSSIEQVYKVIRGRYPASPSDDPVKPSVQNQDQLPLAYIRVRPVTVIGGVRRVNISQTDILHVPKSSDLPADDVSALKPEIDPTNRLRIYVHPGVFPTVDGLSFVEFEGAYSDQVDASGLVNGETRYFLFGVSDDGGVSVIGQSSSIETMPNLDSDSLPLAVMTVVKRAGTSVGEDLLDIRFPFRRRAIPQAEDRFYQIALSDSVFKDMRIDTFREDSFIVLDSLLPSDSDLSAVLNRGSTSLEVTYSGSSQPSSDVTISTSNLLDGAEIASIRHMMVMADSDVTGVTFDYSTVSAYSGFTGRDYPLNTIVELPSGVSQIYVRFKFPASVFDGGASRHLFSYAVFMNLDYEMLNTHSLSSLGLESAAYSIPNLIANGDFKIWSRAPSDSSLYPDAESRDIITLPIDKDTFASREKIFAADGWQFTRLEFDADDGGISRILWSRDAVGSLEENTMDTALRWEGEEGTAGQVNHLEYRVVAPQGYDGQYVTFAFDYISSPREAVGIKIVFYQRNDDGSLTEISSKESGPLRTSGTLLAVSSETLSNKVYAIGFIIGFQQTTGKSTVCVKNARAAVGRYQILPFTKPRDAEDQIRRYYERGQVFASASVEQGEEVGGAVQFGARKAIGLSENNELVAQVSSVASGNRSVNAGNLAVEGSEQGVLARARAISTGLVVVDLDWEAAVVYAPSI